MAPGFCGVVLVVVATLSWTMIAFGSLRQAWLYANGVRIYPSAASVEVAEGEAGEVRDAAFLVHNLTERPVQILGVDASCGCVVPEKLPATVPPLGIKEVRLTLHYEPSEKGTVEQTLVYHTDEPTLPRFTVKVSGRVIDR